ncbi:carbohydrate ABC transporter permease [Amnibacterium setariae]|uniref:Carbohydrate ABC transporter permease n=1 Tax=Amnibacterium setariae TaxID=2306585 RepID=A0A3A1TWD6_9MICO|nr:carbohydrate ABC transporter permease [Amnibacterium setariae]RIX26448.1 carbohydrate ABC transporter permease [Amnibacterium setariae]
MTRADRGRWWRFALLAAITALVLVPVASPVVIAAQRSAPFGGLLPALAGVFANPEAATWFGNSLAVAGATVLAAVALGTPAGYVLSRVAGRRVDAFALVVFAMQALPTVLLIVPLFVLFAPLGLVDDLGGLVLLYVGLTIAVATWTMTTAVDAVPVSLEEAAWLDGCSLFGGFVRVVLPNVAPGVLATAIVTFLFVWNEYLVALVFLPSEGNWTVGIGVVSGRVGAFAVAAMIPPLVVFAVLHRFFRFGGVAGALADR